jgi:DNA-binding NarL/FixJ family response regulator
VYKFLIADDHPLFREAIGSVIQSTFEGSEIIECESLDEAAEQAAAVDDLDLILLDLNMPGMDGLNGLMRMRNESPLVPAVIVSAEEEKSVVLQAITYGAIGFITKSSPRTQMAQALQQILGGNVYLPTDVIHGTASSAKATTSRPAARDESISPEMLESLTRRQLKVLERMAMGESNKQIAYNLSIAETTVKAHVSAILRKLNVHNRIQAVLNAGNIDFSEYLKR